MGDESNRRKIVALGQKFVLVNESTGKRMSLYASPGWLFHHMLEAHRINGIPDDPHRLRYDGCHWEVDRTTREQLDIEALRSDHVLITYEEMPEPDNVCCAFQGVEIRCVDEMAGA